MVKSSDIEVRAVRRTWLDNQGSPSTKRHDMVFWTRLSVIYSCDPSAWCKYKQLHRYLMLRSMLHCTQFIKILHLISAPNLILSRWLLFWQPPIIWDLACSYATVPEYCKKLRSINRATYDVEIME